MSSIGGDLPDNNGNGNGKLSYRKWSQKFALVVGVFLVSTGLLEQHLVNESTWLTVTLGVIGAYICGNVAQKFVEK